MEESEFASISDGDKLRTLAEWFDQMDDTLFPDSKETSVQRDLRRMALRLDVMDGIVGNS